mmetsp:Transcript_17446/g.28966  ORF Transcript_17446/g.28966 Transcript_17446/m.28966 type:complete len:232 (-) Transcript_17446:322-1017(-)
MRNGVGRCLSGLGFSSGSLLSCFFCLLLLSRFFILFGLSLRWHLEHILIVHSRLWFLGFENVDNTTSLVVTATTIIVASATATTTIIVASTSATATIIIASTSAAATIIIASSSATTTVIIPPSSVISTSIIIESSSFATSETILWFWRSSSVCRHIVFIRSNCSRKTRVLLRRWATVSVKTRVTVTTSILKLRLFALRLSRNGSKPRVLHRRRSSLCWRESVSSITVIER